MEAEYLKMWRKVNTYVEKYHMIEEEDRIVVGLSGGGDSVCLLRYLLSIQKQKALKLYAVHVNHMLRGEEAERDQRFAEELCHEWGIPFWPVCKDVEAEHRKRGCSVEEAGRAIRYACFAEAAARWQCNKIAVAHHKNDVAETMVFRMARGTGIRGLTGIPPISGRVVRPLLCLSKEEIRKTLGSLSQDYVEDSTNEEADYARNRIRLHILPELTEINGRAVDHMGRLAEQVTELNEYLSPVFDQLYQENVRFSESCREEDIEKGDAGENRRKEEGNPGKGRKGECAIRVDAFLRLHPVERREIAGRMLIDMAGSQKDISAVHVEQMLQLASGEEGKYQEFPYGLVAERVGKDLRLLPRDSFYRFKTAAVRSQTENIVPVNMEAICQKRTWKIEFEGKTFFFSLEDSHGTNIEKNDCVKYFDCDRINSTLCLRNRRPGDYFILDKEGRRKSLRRYFIDEKIPAAKRDEIIVLAEASHVLWVVGGRISEGYKVRPDTGRVLVVREYEERGQNVTDDIMDNDSRDSVL